MSPNSKHSLQHDAEREASRKRPNALGFVAAIFAAALLLLTLAYFMQLRNNEATLTQSVSAMRSVENLLTENDALHDEVAALNRTVSELNAALHSQTTQMDDMARTIARLTDELEALRRTAEAETEDAQP